MLLLVSSLNAIYTSALNLRSVIAAALSSYSHVLIKLWSVEDTYMSQVLEWANLVSSVVGFLLGCGVTLSVQRLRLGKGATFSDQRNSKVGGDQVGRDLMK
jgi:hypothetical protein